jgi:hypothetical protein
VGFSEGLQPEVRDFVFARGFPLAGFSQGSFQIFGRDVCPYGFAEVALRYCFCTHAVLMSEHTLLSNPDEPTDGGGYAAK